jgi:predicted CXXCH cytochrome family protein
MAKLLAAKTPDLCYRCHVMDEFSKKNVHPPISAGMCALCHEPHKAERKKLLTKSLTKLCLDCHPQVAEEPHAIRGFSQRGHPISSKKVVSVDGKKMRLSCRACHDPHSSDSIRLFRFEASAPYDICVNCHKK